MFQYALGRQLSIVHGVPLMLDTRGFRGYALHQGFELDRVFNIPVEAASPQALRRAIGVRGALFLRFALARPALHRLFGRQLVVEPHFRYWPEIRRVSPPCYLSGYWQSERYFSDIASLIREDFSFKHPLSGRNRELAHEIAESQSVSLHIRRGDYVNNPQTLATHGVCSLDYYRMAVAYMAERVPDPRFYVFSDDPEWVRANLAADHPTVFVDHNQGAESYNDMRLMSMCRHHVIANSTFSWWGGWLNPRPDKIVVAPKQWFANDTPTDDLVPASWVRL